MNKWQKFIQVVVAGIMLVAVCGASPSAVPAMAKAQPQLLQMAAAQPAARLSVIVQKADKTDRAEKLVASLGGTVTQDLHIINAFAAELTAGQAQTLAASPAVRWVSLDAPILQTGKDKPDPPTGGSSSGSKALKVASGSSTQAQSVASDSGSLALVPNTYLDTLGIPRLGTLGLDGRGVGVAVIDSGVSATADLAPALSVAINPKATSVNDYVGHGTHVAGIIAGSGARSGGLYRGVAPGVSLYNLKVCDDQGQAGESDVVVALQWVYDHKAQYNLRVVNLSFNSAVDQSYKTSPLDAAAEVLWFNGVVVVTAAGNFGSQYGFNLIEAAPANDPFVITVGAVDEKGTADRTDDVKAAFSAQGITRDGFLKPEVVAPGKDIISVLSPDSKWGTLYPERAIASGQYFRLSGTSMAAPIVSGLAALLLQHEPGLTPDQVKYRLVATSDWKAGDDGVLFPYIRAYEAGTGTSTKSANTGKVISPLLWTGNTPIAWEAVNWNSVNWNAVNWNAVNWNAVNWNAVNWNSVYWGQ